MLGPGSLVAVASRTRKKLLSCHPLFRFATFTFIFVLVVYHAFLYTDVLDTSTSSEPPALVRVPTPTESVATAVPVHEATEPVEGAEGTMISIVLSGASINTFYFIYLLELMVCYACRLADTGGRVPD